MNWLDYTKRFCDAKERFIYMRAHRKKIWDVSGSSNSIELKALTIHHGIVYLNKTDVMEDLPGLTRYVTWVTAPNTQRKRSHNGTIVQYSTDMVQCRLSCSALWTKLKDIVTPKTIIFAKHKLILDKILTEFDNVVRIDGTTKPSARQRIIDESSERGAMLACSVGAASTGLNATKYNNMVFLECSWSGGERLQCEARVHRMGQNDKCIITYLFIKGTIDEHLWRSLTTKTNRIEQLRTTSIQ